MSGLFKDADPSNVADPLYIFSDPPEKEVEPTPVDAPTTIPDATGRKSKIAARKEAAKSSKRRSGRQSTILSEDDKMGGSK